MFNVIALFHNNRLFSADALKTDQYENPLVSEKHAVKFIADHNQSRCSLYTEAPGDIALYKSPTQKISEFLSNKKNVDINVYASKETKETLIQILIGEKITHFKSDAAYMLKDKLAENNLLTLDRSDPYYGHFRVLSLMDDIATQLVNYVFGDNFDIDAAISGIDSELLIEIKRLSNITVDMFKACFASAYGNHKIGIDKHIKKLAATYVKSILVVQSVASVSNASTLEMSDAINDALPVGQDLLSIAKLTTDAENSKVDNVDTKGSATIEKHLIPKTLLSATVMATILDDESSKLSGDFPNSREESLVTSDLLNNSSSGDAGNGKTLKTATVVVDISSAPLQSTIFVSITTAQEVTAALKDTKQKKDEYKSENGISKTKHADAKTDKELTLLDTYRTCLKNHNSKATNPFEQINAAKKEYEDYMRTKCATESTDGDTSRRSSNASDATASRKDSDAKTPATRRSIFRFF